jgi:hypothetical protein
VLGVEPEQQTAGKKYGADQEPGDTADTHVHDDADGAAHEYVFKRDEEQFGTCQDQQEPAPERA